MATGTLIFIQGGVSKSGSDLMDYTRILALEAHGGRMEVDGILAMYICALNIQHYVHTGQALQRCLLEEITCVS